MNDGFEPLSQEPFNNIIALQPCIRLIVNRHRNN